MHKKVSSVEATLIHVDDNGTVVYGEEVKLDSIQGCRLELPEEIEQLLGVKNDALVWLVVIRRQFRVEKACRESSSHFLRACPGSLRHKQQS